MSRRLQRLLLALFVLVALGFLAWVLFGRWEELRSLESEVRGYPWRLAPGWIAASFALGAASLGGTALAWVGLFRDAGARVGTRFGAAAWLVSNLGRYIPGKVWQLSGLALLVKRRGESGTVAVATSVVLQAVTVLTGVAFALAAVLPAPDGGAELPGLRLLLLLLGLAVLVHPRVVRRATGLLSRWMGEETAPVELDGRAILRAGAALAVVWIGYGLGLWALLRGLTPSAPGPVASIGIFAASYVAGFLVLVSPGGLVAREGAMAALLAALAAYPVGVATAVAVGARLWITAAELATLGVAAAWLGEGNSSGTAADGSREPGAS